ncbi:MAG: hypothetical protein HY049_05115 [Acidobacteria bacterium]|nr:hypothetical protein [Acidobacteriota bacterium]
MSSRPGRYPTGRRARLITITPYNTPNTPQTKRVYCNPEGESHGTLKIPDKSSAAQKWRTVGVPNAAISPDDVPRPEFATRAMTTNCSPISAPATDPAMT